MYVVFSNSQWCHSKSLLEWLITQYMIFKSSPSKSILPVPPLVSCKFNRRKKFQRKFYTLFFCFVCLFFVFSGMHTCM